LELRKATLESHGYRVKTASSGYTAMKMLEATRVSAVILEYKVEGMDAEAIGCHLSNGFPTCQSSCFQGIPRYQSGSCSWWMNM